MGELTHPNSKIVLGDSITPIKRFNNICSAK
jgi:hypothetical protein